MNKRRFRRGFAVFAIVLAVVMIVVTTIDIVVDRDNKDYFFLAYGILWLFYGIFMRRDKKFKDSD